MTGHYHRSHIHYKRCHQLSYECDWQCCTGRSPRMAGDQPFSWSSRVGDGSAEPVASLSEAASRS
jgi:hypothetical protein